MGDTDEDEEAGAPQTTSWPCEQEHSVDIVDPADVVVHGRGGEEEVLAGHHEQPLRLPGEEATAAAGTLDENASIAIPATWHDEEEAGAAAADQRDGSAGPANRWEQVQEEAAACTSHEDASTAMHAAREEDATILPSDVVVSGRGSIEDVLDVLQDIAETDSARIVSEFDSPDDFEKYMDRVRDDKARVVLRKIFPCGTANTFSGTEPAQYSLVHEIWIQDKSNAKARYSVMHDHCCESPWLETDHPSSDPEANKISRNWLSPRHGNDRTTCTGAGTASTSCLCCRACLASPMATRSCGRGRLWQVKSRRYLRMPPRSSGSRAPRRRHPCPPAGSPGRSAVPGAIGCGEGSLLCLAFSAAGLRVPWSCPWTNCSPSTGAS